MPTRIGVTGSPGVGKSTLLRRIAASFGLKVAGVLARDRRLENHRVGFEILDLRSGASRISADKQEIALEKQLLVPIHRKFTLFSTACTILCF